jgi:arginyl-tRNA synthetase
VHPRLLVSKYTAIKQLVCSHLLSSLSIYTEQSQIACILNKNIPLSKGRDDSRVIYISGIALQLSKSHNREAMEIAGGITSHFLVADGDVFSVQVVPPGWIYLELTHPFLAAWLQSLVEGGGKEGETRRQGDKGTRREGDGRLFAVQYAHARCCSLLRLAVRERLIEFWETQSDGNSGFESAIPPKPIPWLNCDQKLRLNHPAELRLIAELVQAVDNLENPDAVSLLRWEKAALNLSQAFETFWSECRIWGEVKITSPELAQARLGLLMATQSVFRFLLEEKIGISALTEL